MYKRTYFGFTLTLSVLLLFTSLEMSEASTKLDTASLVAGKINSVFPGRSNSPESHAYNVSVGIVEPTFTAAAYNNAFYSFYRLNTCILHFQCSGTDHLNLLTGKIPKVESPSIIIDGKPYLQTEVVKLAPFIHQLLPSARVQVVTDAYVNDASSGSSLRQHYDFLILGHQEYITQKEYDNLRNFVSGGGSLICLDGNIFYAQVSYSEVNQTVTLISGHNFGFNGKYAYPGPAERWENETQNWIGSNYYGPLSLSVKPQHQFIRVPLLYKNNPFNYVGHEEQYVTNPGVKIIMNYGAYWLMRPGAETSTAPLGYLPKPPIIATYQKPYGLGQVIVFGIYGDEMLSNPTFLKFFETVLLESLSNSNNFVQQEHTIKTDYPINNTTLKLSISQNKDSIMAAYSITKGYSLAKLGNYTGAIKYYNKALALHSNNTNLLINMGNALSSLGSFRQSIILYDKALLSNPNMTDVVINKASDLAKLGNCSGAISYYGKALDILPNSTIAQQTKQSAITGLRSCIIYFDKVLAIEPNSVNLSVSKGLALLYSGKYSESIASYDKVLKISPDLLPALIGKGSDLLNLGYFNKSIVYFDKALALNPNTVNALIGKGICLVKLRNYSEAIQYFDKAIALNPHSPDALNFRKQAAAAVNKPTSSILGILIH